MYEKAERLKRHLFWVRDAYDELKGILEDIINGNSEYCEVLEDGSIRLFPGMIKRIKVALRK